MGRSKRVRVSTGIYRDATGYTVEARIGSGATALRSDPLRFPLEASPDDYKKHLATMEARYLREKAALKDARTKPAARGTMAADIDLYFQTATLTKRRADERRQQLAWWSARIGDRRRAALEPGELRRHLNTLKASASTRNKYRTALSNMYTVLDGKSAANPFRDVERDNEPPALRREQPTIIVDRILSKIRFRGKDKDSPSRTRARFFVLAYCPVTNAQLCRMAESDVDLVAGAIYPDGRHKGAGTDAQAKAIDADGIAAFKAFAAAGCWQTQTEKPPSRSSMHRTFTAARDAAIAELLKENRPELAADLARAKTMRPYDLRHSFGFAAAQATSIETAGLLLDHKDRRTTLRYVQGAVPEHLKAARDAIAAQRARDRQAAAPSTE